jgi:hypothetical protein
MDSLSTYLPRIVKNLSESISFTASKDQDGITWAEISTLYLPYQELLVLLLGYERGFQVWCLKDENPLLLISKRNSGISVIKALPRQADGLLAMIPLFDSSDFPRNTIRIYSCLKNNFIYLVHCDGEVNNLECNSLVLCASLSSGVIEIFTAVGFEKLYTVSMSRPDLKDYTIRMALSNMYIAYSLGASGHSDSYTNDNTFTERITKTFWGIADQSLNAVKSYIEHTGFVSSSGPVGRITIRSVIDSKSLCEIQAFPSSISMLKFSPSSHLLVAAPESGHTFHIYRINPAKNILNVEAGSRYTLLYKLHRGFTQASISDIHISSDEQWVCVSSARGTTHVYHINPVSVSLNYNHQVYTRIRHGTILENPAPRCAILLNSKMVPRENRRLDEEPLAQAPPEIWTITLAGMLSKYTVEEEPIAICEINVRRSVSFREKETKIQVERAAVNEAVEYLEHNTYEPNTGWIPLTKSPQIKFFTTDARYEQNPFSEIQLEPMKFSHLEPNLTIHYCDLPGQNAKILEALTSSIDPLQVADEKIDPEFLEHVHGLPSNYQIKEDYFA